MKMKPGDYVRVTTWFGGKEFVLHDRVKLVEIPENLNKQPRHKKHWQFQSDNGRLHNTYGTLDVELYEEQA